MATKKFLDYDGLKTFWSKVKTHVSTTAMSKDGSNYEGGLMLVTPLSNHNGQFLILRAIPYSQATTPLSRLRTERLLISKAISVIQLQAVHKKHLPLAVVISETLFPQ